MNSNISNAYVPLHCHTDHSTGFDGFQTIQELVARAKEVGAPACAITDHGTMSGCFDFYQECVAQGIKPVIGMEAYFVPEPKVHEKGAKAYHLVLLAMNNEGYENLKELDAEAYEKENFYYKARIGWESLQAHNDGIICLTACLASIINTDDGEEWFCKFHELFGNRFFAEVQPNEFERQYDYNQKVISLAEKYGVPIVVTTDAHFSRKEDLPYHKLWIAVSGKSYYDNENYVMTGDEILQHGMKAEWLQNTLRIVDMCDVSIGMEGNHYPVFPTEDREQKIREICESNWKSLVPPDKEDEYRTRYEAELKTLAQVGYLNYLLIIWDMLNYCHESGIPTGVGRGSVGGSLVCYLMRIHMVDPIKYGLKFFRFVNPYRVTPCDIDTDVATPRREEVVEYVRRKYGHVSKIFTQNRLSEKSALKRAGQALGVAPKQVQDISDRAVSLDDIPSMNYVSLPRDVLSKLADTAKHFMRRIEKMGIHASAILVTPEKITSYCPLEGAWSTDKNNGGKTWTRAAAYDWHKLEGEFGLLKLDILGLNTLVPLYQTLEKEGISLSDIPIDDKETYETYASGNLLGVFQMDSPGMRGIAKELHVKEFKDVRALVALYRPGPIDSGMLQQYVDGANGAEVSYPCETFESLTKSTYGVLVYQETVMLTAMKMAGYNLGEADKLRKVIGRKEMDKIHAATQEFISRCISRGYSEDVAKSVASQIEAAGRYLFNLSHATEYGYLSYITAYLKTHYPKDYLCAVINSKETHADILPLIEELERMHVKILSPDFRKKNREWQVEDGGVRVGLGYIKGVGRNLVFPEDMDWLSLVQANGAGISKALIQAGAYDFLGKSRAWMLANLDSAKKAKQPNPDQLSLFDDLDDDFGFKEVPPLKGYDDSVGEYGVLSFTFKKMKEDMQVSVISVNEFADKNGNLMAKLLMNTPYGKQTGIVFSSAWRRAVRMESGGSYEIHMEKGIISKSRRA